MGNDLSKTTDQLANLIPGVSLLEELLNPKGRELPLPVPQKALEGSLTPLLRNSQLESSDLAKLLADSERLADLALAGKLPKTEAKETRNLFTEVLNMVPELIEEVGPAAILAML
jgi:hypothetical protein